MVNARKPSQVRRTNYDMHVDFLSFSQNFEDFRLWRALQDVEEGSYLDIGSYDPVYDSVSAHFYENGWRGVNVEPIREEFEKYGMLRGEDLTLNLAIAAQQGEIDFHQFLGTGLSTADPDTAFKISNYPSQTFRVNTITLDMLLDLHPRHDIHWMKIDVEGFEDEVLRGWNTNHKRPWIIVIEATTPSSRTRRTFVNHPTILKFGYVFSYFDGLNEFFVHKSQLKLSDKLIEPISIFDQVLQTSNFMPHVILEQKIPINLEIFSTHLKVIASDYLKTLGPEFEFLHSRFTSLHPIAWNQFLSDDGKANLGSHYSSIMDTYLLKENIRKELALNALITQELFGLRAKIKLIEESRTFRYTRPFRVVFFKILGFRKGELFLHKISPNRIVNWAIKKLLFRVQSNLYLRTALLNLLPNSIAKKLRIYVMTLQYAGLRKTFEVSRFGGGRIEPSELHRDLISIWKN